MLTNSKMYGEAAETELPFDWSNILQMIPFRLLYATSSTPDIERASAWYQEKLEFEQLFRFDFPEFGTTIIHLGKADFRMELIQQNGSVPSPIVQGDPPGHTNVQGLTQICFMVDDLDQLIAELEAKGVEKVWEKRENPPFGVDFQFFKDCDGRLLQFVQLRPDAVEQMKGLVQKSGFKFSYQ